MVNWCARAGCESSSCCMTDVGVEVSERVMSSARWLAAMRTAFGVISSPSPSGPFISPGATG